MKLGYLFLLAALGNVQSRAALMEIAAGDLLGDATVLDFEAGTPGPISSNDPLFTTSGLLQVTLQGSGTALGDDLGSGTDGNALGAVNGALAIIAPGGPFDDFPLDITFDIAGTATQFGFQVIDQINTLTLTVETLLGGAVQDSTTYAPTGSFPNPVVYYESSVPIDQVRITTSGSIAFGVENAVVSSGSGGFALDNFTLAGIAASGVPEPSTLSMLGIALVGLGMLRRRKQKP